MAIGCVNGDTDPKEVWKRTGCGNLISVLIINRNTRSGPGRDIDLTVDRIKCNRMRRTEVRESARSADLVSVLIVHRHGAVPSVADVEMAIGRIKRDPKWRVEIGKSTRRNDLVSV